MKFQFQFKGLNYQAEAQRMADKIWVHFQGKTFAVDADEKKYKSGKKAASGPQGQILSPMPGKITKLFKKAGDPVKAGEIVLVMEAMKMEYNLKSEVDGIIKDISCQVGEQVSLGKKLCFVETVGGR